MKLYWTLSASLLIHLIWFILLSLGAHAPVQSKQTPVQVEYLPEPNLNGSRTFVRSNEPTEDLKEALKNLKKRAQYISDRARRVEKESISKNSGATKQKQQSDLTKSPNKLAKKNQSDSQKKNPIQNLIKKDLAGEIPIVSKSQLERQRKVSLGPTEIQTYIPNVEEGYFTSLNTDQFLYYTFFARAQERVGFTWTREFLDYMENLKYNDLVAMSHRPLVTRLEILLDKEGNYKKAHIRQTSGYPLLDQVAVEGIRKATPLPNPPEDMIEEDGFIHLHYSFVVKLRPRNFVRPSAPPATNR